MNQKNQKGITLIALVVTIIVLLILAGVTINMVLGDDGIIGQAQQAKVTQEEKEKEEKDELDKGAGNIDLYREGSLASKVEVGDYVKYNYTEAQYDTDDTADIGVSQKFNSASTTTTNGVKGVKVTAWRVLSKKDGIVKLVSETPTSTYLDLHGAKGWVNGTKVLNEMCKALYSSDIGTGRSINIEDINEVTGYKIPEVIDELSYGVNGEMDLPYGTTIKEAAKTAGSNGTAYDMSNFSSNTPETGKNIGDYELSYYSYGGADTQMGETEYKMLFQNLDNTSNFERYWLASTSISADFSMKQASFYMRIVHRGGVGNWFLYGSDNESKTNNSTVRPVIVLKTGLDAGEKEKIILEAGREVEAWTIKAD